jgi:AcrR family transcriptional regulator
MGSKGRETRERIVEQAAALFNQKGYAACSMADLMEVTGLQKGGLYRHFASKEELALEALDFAVARMAERFAAAVESRRDSVDRLVAIAEVYGSLPHDPPVAGGCPLMNAAVENDDAGSTLLRDRAREAMEEMQKLIARVVRGGQGRGEIRADADPAEVATVLTGMAEGGLMLAKLYDDARPMRQAIEHLRWYLETRVRARD